MPGKRPKKHTQDSVDTLFDLSLNYLLSNFIAEEIATAVMYLSFNRSITTTPTEGGPPVFQVFFILIESLIQKTVGDRSFVCL